MAFTSVAFMVFAPLMLCVYYFIKSEYRVLLVSLGSLIFYAYWEISYVPLLFASAIVDYFCAIKIYETKAERTRRLWLLASIALNIGILGYFKYANFFMGNIAHVAGFEFAMRSVVLPLGISFYTLQTLSYTIDTFKGKQVPERNFVIYFGYVSFFPQLVAGPIERASSLLPQIRNLGTPTLEDVERGLVLIAWGFFAKLVVADNLAGFVHNSYFESSGGLMLWPVAYLSLCQVYCDFFGYTLIARGLAWCMGVKLSLNFRQPLLAKNLTGFWQRWHISLTRWVTDYLHIPLARRFPEEPWRSALGIMAMCIVGLWHGASWNFVLFGLLHGLGMRLWTPIAGVASQINAGSFGSEVFPRIALALVTSAIAPFFFLTDTQQLISQVGSMYSTSLGIEILTQGHHRIALLIGVAALGVFLLNDVLVFRKSKYHLEAICEQSIPRIVSMATILLAIILLGNFDQQGFIYFDF